MKIKAILVVIMLVLTIGLTAGCIDTSKTFTICNKITYMPVRTEWQKHGVIVLNNSDFYSILYIEDRHYSVMKYAYEHNCNVSITIQTYLGGELKISDAYLIEC